MDSVIILYIAVKVTNTHTHKHPGIEICKRRRNIDSIDSLSYQSSGNYYKYLAEGKELIIGGKNAMYLLFFEKIM